MKFSVKNKVAVITGSSRGIGKAVALALAEKGAKVVLNGRNEQRLRETEMAMKAAGFDCLAVAGDISSYSQCERLIDESVSHFGQIDILINNAGLSAEGTIEETAPEVFKTIYETNLLGVIYPTKAALAEIKKQKGSIVFIGSIAGFMGLPGFSTYSASKMALTALAQSLKIELAGSGVHIGLNYVGFAENDTEKTFINKDGDLEYLPVRKGFQKMPIAKVADKIVRGIEYKRYKQIFSGLGRLTAFLQKFYPRVFEWVMIRRYKKTQERSN